MGRHVRKRKESVKVAVMEKEAAASRKRKSLSTSTSSIQLKMQLSGEVRPENSASPSSWGNSTCEGGSSSHILAPCCSSTEGEESTKFADLKENEASMEFPATMADDSVDFRDRREKTELKFCGCSVAEKMPTEAELEEFFAAAETNLQRQFIDKYNYDIVKDVSLEGRYEWVQAQPKR